MFYTAIEYKPIKNSANNFIIGKTAGLYVMPATIIGLFYLYTISKINVAAAILLHCTGPVFVTLYAVIFAHYRLRLPTIIAIFGTLSGCFLVVGGFDLNLPAASELI